MAKVQNPIIGAGSGKAGGMVFSKVFGNNIIRAAASTYRDNPSSVQLQKRADITIYSRLLSAAVPYLSTFFAKQPVGMSFYSFALGFFMKNCNMDPTYGNLSVTSVTMQRGNIRNVLIDNIQRNLGGNSIFFVDPSNTVSIANPAKCHILALYPVTGEVEYHEFDMTSNTFQFNLTPSNLVQEADPIFILHSKRKATKFKSGSDLSKTVR